MDDILVNQVVEKGEHFFIEAGKLHGIGKGIELFEIQQANDTTYRVYDYDRTVNKEKRTLHLSKAFQVMKFPDDDVQTKLNNPYFTVEKIKVNEETSFVSHQYGDYLYVACGSGTINHTDVMAYDFIFVSSHEKYQVNGQLTLLKSTILKEKNK